MSFHVRPSGAGGGAVDLSGTQRVVAVPLGDADTPGGILTWENPAGVDIVLARVLALAPTAIADAAHTLDIQAGAEVAVTGSAQLHTGGARYWIDLSSLLSLVLLAGETLTFSTTPDSGTAAGLAGYVYIAWHPAA